MAQPHKPPRIFLDSSVLFAASASQTGASHAIVLLAEIGLLRLVVSPQIFQEVERNLLDKAPRAYNLFLQYQRALDWEMVAEPELAQVVEAAQHIAAKDAPILAAAMLARVDRLATLDVRDFRTEAVLKYSKLEIRTPGELLEEIRRVMTAGLTVETDKM